MATINNIYTDTAGQVTVTPRRVTFTTPDNYTEVTTAGYMNNIAREGFPIYPTDEIHVIYSIANGAGTLGVFYPVIANGIITLNPAFIENNSNTPQTVNLIVSGAAPGTVRALSANIESASANQTGGNLVGLRGSVTVASGNTAGTDVFLYGVQGKCIIDGVMNAGSGWITGALGQLDISSATLTAGNLSCLWGDAGSTGPNMTASNFDLLRLTNSTATTGNSHLFTYGKATMWADINDNGAGFVTTAGSGTVGANPVKIKCTINGVTKYLLAADNWS